MNAHANASVDAPSGSNIADAKLERRSRNVWVTAVVGLLSLQVIGGVTTVMLAVGDPTGAIIPNYHSKAVNWDSTRRALQMTDELGLAIRADATISPVDSSKRTLLVEVFDREQQPVTQFRLHAKVFHHARGSEVHSVALDEAQPGVYVASTSLSQAGMWQLELQIEGEHGIAAVSQEMFVE